MYCQNRPHLISKALKCVGGWGSAPEPTGGAYDAPPDPLIVRGIAPSAHTTHYFVSIFKSQFPFRASPLLNSWIRHCILHYNFLTKALFFGFFVVYICIISHFKED